MVRIISLIFLITLLSHCASSTSEGSLNDAELDKIRELHGKYLQGWLANNENTILDLFVDDAVLIPHHGDPVVVGKSAIKEFWWPEDYPPVNITNFSSTISEIDGFGDLAYVRGRFQLAFDIRGRSFSNEGNYLNVCRKVDGEWKITHRIWNDPVARQQ